MPQSNRLRIKKMKSEPELKERFSKSDKLFYNLMADTIFQVEARSLGIIRIILTG